MSRKLLIFLFLLAFGGTADAAKNITTTYQDWWGNAAQSGMGVSIGQQGDHVVAAWFHFAADGRPVYLMLSGELKEGAVSGDLTRVSGPLPEAGYDPALVHRASAGSGTLRFLSLDRAELAYQFDNQSGTLALERFNFNAPPLKAGTNLAGAVQVTRKMCRGTESNGLVYEVKGMPADDGGMPPILRYRAAVDRSGYVALEQSGINKSAFFIKSIYQEAAGTPLTGLIESVPYYGFSAGDTGYVRTGQQHVLPLQSQTGIVTSFEGGAVRRNIRTTDTLTVNAVLHINDVLLVDYSIKSIGHGEHNVNDTLECEEQGRIFLRQTKADATPVKPAAADYQDWWGNPSLSGMGVNIGQRGDVLVASWYHFGADKRGTYLLLSGTVKNGRLEGELSEASGPPPGVGYDPTRVQRKNAGTASIEFKSANAAVLTYNYTGGRGTLDLQRFTYRALPEGDEQAVMVGSLAVEPGCGWHMPGRLSDQDTLVLVSSRQVEGKNQYGLYLETITGDSKNTPPFACGTREAGVWLSDMPMPEGGLIQTGEILSGAVHLKCTTEFGLAPVGPPSRTEKLTISGEGEITNLRLDATLSTLDFTMNMTEVNSGEQCAVKGAFRGTRMRWD